MKNGSIFCATCLAVKIAQEFAIYAVVAMALVTTKMERMYQIHTEKSQMRLAPKPCASQHIHLPQKTTSWVGWGE
jgi:hypothetical protein